MICDSCLLYHYFVCVFVHIYRKKKTIIRNFWSRIILKLKALIGTASRKLLRMTPSYDHIVTHSIYSLLYCCIYSFDVIITEVSFCTIVMQSV